MFDTNCRCAANSSYTHMSLFTSVQTMTGICSPVSFSITSELAEISDFLFQGYILVGLFCKEVPFKR